MTQAEAGTGDLPVAPTTTATRRRGITCVVPIFNGCEHFVRQAPLLDRGLEEDPGLSVVWVDNGSTDGVQHDVGAFSYGRGKLIRNDDNLGFTRAVNQGIAAANPNDDILLLNTDISWDGTAAWMRALQAVPGAGIVAPRLRGVCGDLQGVGSYMTDDARGIPGRAIGEDRGQYARLREVEHLTFACVLITRECLDAIGPLDESMVLYYSDTMYCVKAARAGFKVMLHGGVTVVHWEGGSIAKQPSAFVQRANVRDRAAFLCAMGLTGEQIGPYLQGPPPGGRMPHREPIYRPWHRHSMEATLHGPVGAPSGYGKLASLTAIALDRAGVRLAVGKWLKSMTMQEVVNGVPEPHLVADMMAREPNPDAPCLALCIPEESHQRGRGRNVVATMLEPEPIPRAWAESCNDFDEVWTYSQFNRRTFTEGGVTKPIRVLPPPLDVDLYHPGIEPIKLVDGGKRNILATFEWGWRKHPNWLVHAAEVLDEDTTVWLRTYGPTCERDLRTMLSRIPNRRYRVKWLPDRIEECLMGSWYRAMDLSIALGAEGIGLPMLESLACGTPCLVLDWGAGAEWAHVFERGCVFVAPGKERTDGYAVSGCRHYVGSFWPNPDWGHFKEALGTWSEGDGSALRDRALGLYERMVETCSLEAAGKAWRLALEELG